MARAAAARPLLTVLRPTFERRDARGLFWELLNEGQWQSVLHGTMAPKAVMGNHYHRRTDVCFFLLTGTARVVCVDPRTTRRAERTLQAREGLLLKRGLAHAIRFETEAMFLMLKSARYKPEAPDAVSYRVL